MDAEEDLRQELLFNMMRPAMLILQNQGGDAVPALAVAEEVEELKPSVLHQALPQSGQCGRRLEEGHLDAVAERFQGTFQGVQSLSATDLGHVESGDIPRRRDDTQQTGPFSDRCSLHPPHVQVAGEGGVGRAGEGELAIRVCQELPVQSVDPLGEVGRETQAEA